jgi:hypothetical protein
MHQQDMDGPAFKATLKSSRLVLDEYIHNASKPTSPYMEWFIIRMDGLLQFSGRQHTRNKLQEITKTLKQAKRKIQGEAIHPDFYILAQHAQKLIDEILNA